jgi:hypothetical protein
MEKKFIKLFESVYQRYQREGGFLIGDYVKFKDNYKSAEHYKNLNDDVKEKLDGMKDSGLNMRVVDVKSYMPAATPANPAGNGVQLALTIALDQGGGRYSDYNICCPSLLVKDDVYPNLNPLSPEREIKHKVNIKPEELESDEEAYVNNSDVKGNGKLGFGDRKLRNKNVTLNSKPATKSMQVNSYTKEYLKGLK